jgi:hypothetical protein
MKSVSRSREASALERDEQFGELYRRGAKGKEEREEEERTTLILTTVPTGAFSGVAFHCKLIIDQLVCVLTTVSLR